jgi:hypothetical protein
MLAPAPARNALPMKPGRGGAAAMPVGDGIRPARVKPIRSSSTVDIVITIVSATLLDKKRSADKKSSADIGKRHIGGI